MRMKPYIQLRNVTKGWITGGERITTLTGVDLDVYLGQSVAIVGPSGSGKSTLLHILGLLTPVDSGSISFHDVEVKTAQQWWDREIRLSVGIIFQDAKLISNLNVIENVAIPLLHRGVWPALQRKLAVKALEKVGLSHRFKHNPNQLSGGELMRVAIARALVIEPKLILADEPTGTLDSKTGEIIANLMYDLVTPETSLVLVTHHPPLAARANRTLEIRDGILAEQK